MMEKKLPEGWEPVKIGDIYYFPGGGTPSKANSSYWNGDISWASIKDISRVEVLESTQDYITESGLKNSASNLAQIGEIIIGTRMSPGKPVLTKIVTAINQDLKIVRSSFPIPSLYTYYLFRNLEKEFESRSAGTTVKGIRLDAINDIIIPLPPLAEQKRIVAKLGMAFGHLDTLKASLARIPEFLKTFRQSVLTQAVTGKLTEDWREVSNFPNSEKLLQSTLKRKSVFRNKQALSFQLPIDDPFEIPEKWLFSKLGELAEKITYGTSEKSLNEGLVPVLRMGNLQNGKIDWTDLKYTSNPEEIKKYALKRGDVLFNRTNSPELVGKTSIYEKDTQSIYAGYLIKIWNFEELNSYFLNYVLNSQYGRNWSWSVKSDGVSQSNINAQKLANFIIPLPSLEEQQEIVNRVEDLFAKADVIEDQYVSLKEKIDKLPQALLAKAFRGELVPQDPAEEPASVLLAKIQQEMGKLGKKGKRQMEFDFAD